MVPIKERFIWRRLLTGLFFSTFIGISSDLLAQASWRITGNSNTDSDTHFLGTTDSNDLVLRTDSTEKARITRRGRVGIGTDDPQQLLHLENSDHASDTVVNALRITHLTSDVLQEGFGVGLELQATGAGGTGVLLASIESVLANSVPGSESGSLQFRTTASGESVPQFRMALTDVGNLGINLEDPGARLVIRNDSLGQRPLFSAVAGDNTTLQISSMGSVTVDPVGPGIALRVRADTLSASGNATPIPLYVTGEENVNAIYVTRDGDVGIGTAGEGITDKLRIRGPENNGTRAAVRIVSGSQQQTMLLDGNEIDSLQSGLFLNNNTENDVILANGGGNVGVGLNNPNHELVIQSDDPVLQLRDDTTDNSANAARIELLERAGGNFNGGAFFLWNGNSNRLHVGTSENGNNSNVLTVDRENQSVGIGTQSTGSSRLAVRNPNHQIRVIDSDNNKTWTMTTHQSSQGLGFWEDGSDPRFLVTAGGRVGIGTTNPNHELVVQGNDPAFQIRDDTVDNSANAARLELLERAGGSFDGGAYLWWDGAANKFLIGTKESGNNTNVLVVDRETSSVGIGTQNPGNFRLAVNGPIRAKEIVVDTGWADDVFEDDYKLISLNQLENYIDKHGLLPNIPSAEEVAKNGIGVGEMESKLLRKVEELTLYVIDLHKRISELEHGKKPRSDEGDQSPNKIALVTP